MITTDKRYRMENRNHIQDIETRRLANEVIRLSENPRLVAEVLDDIFKEGFILGRSKKV